MEEACHVFLPAINYFQQKAGKPKMGEGGGQVVSQGEVRAYVLVMLFKIVRL